MVEFSEKFNVPGKVEWAVNWTPSRDGFTQSYCNTVPTPEGGTHEAGFWAAILKGIRAYGELISNRKAAQITREDLITGGCALVSCFIREPEFVGQTKDRLATTEAQRLVEGAVRDHFDNWLAERGEWVEPATIQPEVFKHRAWALKSYMWPVGDLIDAPTKFEALAKAVVMVGADKAKQETKP